MSVDGWSNLTNNPVVGIAITCNGRTILDDAIDTTGSPHTAEYMAVTLDGIKKAEEVFGVELQI